MHEVYVYLGNIHITWLYNLGTKYDIFLKVIWNVDKVNNLHVYQSFYWLHSRFTLAFQILTPCYTYMFYIFYKSNVHVFVVKFSLITTYIYLNADCIIAIKHVAYGRFVICNQFCWIWQPPNKEFIGRCHWRRRCYIEIFHLDSTLDYLFSNSRNRIYKDSQMMIFMRIIFNIRDSVGFLYSIFFI